MSCKICGRTVNMPMGLPVVMVIPTCDCGRARKHIRARGCSKCHKSGPEHFIIVTLKKRWHREPDYNTLHCACPCGHEWNISREKALRL